MDDELEEIRERKKKEMMERLSGSNSKGNPEAPDAPVVLDDGSIDAAVKQHALLVVDCWAAWCGPCKMIAPIIEELARKYKGKIAFGKLNVDQNQQTSVKYQIMSIPSLLVFKQGKHVDTLVGYMPAGALEQRLSKYL